MWKDANSLKLDTSMGFLFSSPELPDSDMQFLLLDSV